jgi:hypothetical protein
MNNPNQIVYNSDFTDDFYYSEIEKYKSIIQDSNKPKILTFKETRNTINQNFTNQSIDYVGNFSTYSILENGNLIGTLNCFKNNQNNYFTLFTFND